MALTPTEKLAAALAAIAAAIAGITVVKQPPPPPPPVVSDSTAIVGWHNCKTVEQVFYAGDSLFYVRPLGTPSRDSLVRADSTKDPAKPYGPQVLVCMDSAKAREVINSGIGIQFSRAGLGFGLLQVAIQSALNYPQLEREVVPSMRAGG